MATNTFNPEIVRKALAEGRVDLEVGKIRPDTDTIKSVLGTAGIAPPAKRQEQRGSLAQQFNISAQRAVVSSQSYFNRMEAGLEDTAFGRFYNNFLSPEAVQENQENRERRALELAAHKQRIDALAQQYPITRLSDVDGLRSGMRFIAEQAAASLPYTMTTIASGALSPIVVLGLAGDAALEELDEKTDLSENQKLALATGTGVLMWGFEAIGAGAIMRGLGPKQFASMAATGKLADFLASKGMAPAAARITQAGVVEGSTELIQEGLIMGAAGLGGGEYTREEVTSRLTEAFVGGGAVGGTLRTAGELLPGGSEGRDKIEPEQVEELTDADLGTSEISGPTTEIEPPAPPPISPSIDPGIGAQTTPKQPTSGGDMGSAGINVPDYTNWSTEALKQEVIKLSAELQAAPTDVEMAPIEQKMEDIFKILKVDSVDDVVNPKIDPNDIEIAKVIDSTVDGVFQISGEGFTPQQNLPSNPVPALEGLEGTYKYLAAKPGGESGKGGVFTHLNGDTFYIKTYKNPDAVLNEATALSLVQSFAEGYAPTTKVEKIKNGVALATQDMNDGHITNEKLVKLDPNNPVHVEAMKKDFVFNAWIGNWDWVGNNYENVMIAPGEGKAVYFDMGGSMYYHGLGTHKGLKFGPVVTEVKGFLDPLTNPKVAKMFKENEPEPLDIANQVWNLFSKVFSMVEDGTWDQQFWFMENSKDNGKLQNQLIKRLQYLIKTYGSLTTTDDKVNYAITELEKAKVSVATLNKATEKAVNAKSVFPKSKLVTMADVNSQFGWVAGNEEKYKNPFVMKIDGSDTNALVYYPSHIPQENFLEEHKYPKIEIPNFNEIEDKPENKLFNGPDYSGLIKKVGVFATDKTGKLVLTVPSNAFAGTEVSIPKETLEPNKGTMQQQALERFWEGTGLIAELDGTYIDVEYNKNHVRVYLAKDIIGGAPTAFKLETEATMFVSYDIAKTILHEPFDNEVWKTIFSIPIGDSDQNKINAKEWKKKAKVVTLGAHEGDMKTIWKKIFNSPEYKAMIESKEFRENYKTNAVWLDPITFEPTLEPTGFPLLVWHHTSAKVFLEQGDTFMKYPFEMFKKGAGSEWGGTDIKYGTFFSMPHNSWGQSGAPMVTLMENPKIMPKGINYSANSFNKYLSDAKNDGHDWVIFPESGEKNTQIVGLYGEFETKIKHLSSKTWKFKTEPTMYAQKIKFPSEREAKAPNPDVIKKLHQVMKKFGLEDKVKLTIFSNNEAERKGYAGYFEANAHGFFMGVSAANGDIESTFNHEVMHALIELGFFTKQQLAILKRMAERKWKRLYGTEETYQDLPKSEQWKEAVARAFEEHMKETREETGIVKQIFQEISNFFSGLMNWARGYGFITSKDIFEFITNEQNMTWQINNSDYLSRGFEQTMFKSKLAAKKVGVKNPKTANADYYGKLVKHGWSVIQLAKKNLHVPWLQEYVQQAGQWHNKKMQWMSKANETTAKWNSLPFEQQKALANVIFDVEQMIYRTKDEIDNGVKRKPTKAELVAIFQKHGLEKEGVNVYVQVRKDFDSMLNEIERITLEAIARDLAGNPIALSLEQAKAKKEFAEMRKSPYFPHARFGQFTVVVKDAAGKTVYAEMFETEKARAKAMPDIEAKFKNHTIAQSKLSEETQLYRGMPHALLVSLKMNLKLNPTQEQALDAMIVQSLPGVSFKNHFVKKENIEGFSRDALRAYADYFWHGANHVARIEYGPLMEDAILKGAQDIKQMINTGQDSTKRVMIRDHLLAHYDEIMNPKPNLQWVNSVGFLWWLGYNVESAIMNFSQVPMVTYSHLGAQFGDVQAARSLSSTMASLQSLYRSPEKAQTQATKADALLIAMGIEQGFLDESFAAHLAGLAEGSALVQGKANTKAMQMILKFNHWAGYLFQAVEKLNRRVSFMAAVNLARRNPNAKYLDEVRKRFSLEYQDMVNKGMSPTEATAFLAGKDTVESTQFNYSAWARPRVMQGKANAFLTFFMFTQNMLWFIQNSPGSTRYLLLLLLFGGIMGMPFAEDIEEIIKAVGARAFGKEWNMEKELREILVETMGEDGPPPDLFLRGVSRYGFGLPVLADMTGLPLPSFDMSGNIGMGSPLPIISPLIQSGSQVAQGGDFEEALGKFTTEGVGATLGIPIGIIKALSDSTYEFTDPKRWESAAPAALSAASKAVRYYTEGEERTRSGAGIVEFDKNDPNQMAEIIGQFFGFRPTRVSQTWDKIAMQREAQRFWTIRRQILFTQYDRAKRTGDPEERKEALAAVNRFNQSVPYRQLRITRQSLERSFTQRELNRQRQEAGQPGQKIMNQVVRDIQRLHPEVRQTFSEEPLPSSR